MTSGKVRDLAEARKARRGPAEIDPLVAWAARLGGFIAVNVGDIFLWNRTNVCVVADVAPDRRWCDLRVIRPGVGEADPMRMWLPLADCFVRLEGEILQAWQKELP